MPIYEYRCPQCGAKFEQLVSYSKAGEVPCPSCGYVPAHRRISRVAARISGGTDAWSDSSGCGGASSGVGWGLRSRTVRSRTEMVWGAQGGDCARYIGCISNKRERKAQ
jgi:putative FmdB family regulatory protein